jgi:hypothetical protein
MKEAELETQCSAKQALEMCELWFKSDIQVSHDSPFIENIKWRLACVLQGLEALRKGKQCEAITRAGMNHPAARCKFNARPGEHYCARHSPLNSSSPRLRASAVKTKP